MAGVKPAAALSLTSHDDAMAVEVWVVSSLLGGAEARSLPAGGRSRPFFLPLLRKWRERCIAALSSALVGYFLAYHASFSADAMVAMVGQGHSVDSALKLARSYLGIVIIIA